jgi:hypothetical protein
MTCVDIGGHPKPAIDGRLKTVVRRVAIRRPQTTGGQQPVAPHQPKDALTAQVQPAVVTQCPRNSPEFRHSAL